MLDATLPPAACRLKERADSAIILGQSPCLLLHVSFRSIVHKFLLASILGLDIAGMEDRMHHSLKPENVTHVFYTHWSADGIGKNTNCTLKFQDRGHGFRQVAIPPGNKTSI